MVRANQLVRPNRAGHSNDRSVFSSAGRAVEEGRGKGVSRVREGALC
jgi:hypothetical protein